MSGGGTSWRPCTSSPAFFRVGGCAASGPRSKFSNLSARKRRGDRAAGSSICVLLPQLAHPFGLRRTDQKFVHERADLEQALDLAAYPTQGKLALFFRGRPFCDQQRAEPGAADIFDILEI